MQSKSTILVGLAVVLGVSYAIASRQGTVNKPDDGDWLYVDHDLAGTRYSHLKQITTKSVSQLAKVCAYSFPDKEPSQTAPIVSAGIMYLTTAHYTVAVDGSDCHVVWTSQWAPRDHETLNTQRGAALAGGKIIRGTGDGYLLALDAKDGHSLWTRQIANPKEGYFISMPPLVHGDLVYIGPAGAEWASKGWVGAFRISDGEQAWRFNIVPDDGEAGANTWGTDSAARKHGGGNLWTPMTFDEEKNLLYVPGGNAAPDIYDEGRPGANLYTNSLIALDTRIKGVALTGSERAGLAVAAEAGKALKKTTMELGGSDAFIVLDDADMDKAIEWAIFGRMNNAGQCCIGAKRFILEETIADEFLSRFKSELAKFVPGDPADPNTTLAPLCTDGALKLVQRQIDSAIKGGATVLLGGERVDRPGYFLEPTILTNIQKENPAYYQEFFAPVALIFRVKTDEEAVKLANDSPYGLGGSIITKDIERGKRIARQIEAGMVFINQATWTAPDLPFGGVKNSGYGRELSALGIGEFANKKLIRVA